MISTNPLVRQQLSEAIKDEIESAVLNKIPAVIKKAPPIPVLLKSSYLKSVSYDNTTMVIEFQSGKRFSYGGVPPNIYLGLIQALSPGSFFHRRIKNNYNGVQLRQ